MWNPLWSFIFCMSVIIIQERRLTALTWAWWSSEMWQFYFRVCGSLAWCHQLQDSSLCMSHCSLIGAPGECSSCLGRILTWGKSSPIQNCGKSPPDQGLEAQPVPEIFMRTVLQNLSWCAAMSWEVSKPPSMQSMCSCGTVFTGNRMGANWAFGVVGDGPRTSFPHQAGYHHWLD
jgi:hypothetical protein